VKWSGHREVGSGAKMSGNRGAVWFKWSLSQSHRILLILKSDGVFANHKIDIQLAVPKQTDPFTSRAASAAPAAWFLSVTLTQNF